MTSYQQLQDHIASVALRACSKYGFALAGSGAIRAHGLTERPTADLDLFTIQSASEQFDVAVRETLRALEPCVDSVRLIRSAPSFAQLYLQRGDWSTEIDMAVDWRSKEPAVLSIGPVLSMDDAIANKVLALYSRAEARDYLDVDSIRMNSTLSDEELMTLAENGDPGFDRLLFAERIATVDQISPERVLPYGVKRQDFEGVVNRCREWAEQICSQVSQD